MARSKNLKQKILALHELGLNQSEIARQLDCTRSTIQYHTIPSAKEKIRQNSYNYNYKKKWHPYKIKLTNFSNQKPRIKKSRKVKLRSSKQIIQNRIYNFLYTRKRGIMNDKINVDDVINKISENPKCYLTGDDIDIHKTKTYNFDHIIPVSRGGDNSIDNLNICTKQVNFAKGNNTNEEFFELCKKVLIYQGYEVTKKL